MIGRGNSYLGLAFAAENTIACAEVAIAGGVRSVRRAATFVLSADLTSDNATAAGQALANFLRQQKFSTSRAVVGVPARWLVALEKDLPPADAEQAHAALRLQAERLAVAESGEMIFDFAGETHRSTASKVLLVGMQRQRLERITKLLDAAGMTVVAVTSSGLSLSAVVEGDDNGVLTLNGSGAELVWRQAGNPRMLRHVPLALNGNQAPATTLLAGEFRRMIAMAGTNGSTSSRSLLLVDSLGLSGEQIDTLSQRLGVPVVSKSQREMLGVEAAGDSDSADLSPAIALGLLAAKDKLPLDFAHSRLAPPVQHRFGRIGTIAIVAGALALCAIIALFVIVQIRQAELDKLNGQSRAMKDQVTAAKASIDRLKTGRGYFEFDKRTPVLENLRQITDAFRPEDRIWVTSFGLKDSPDGYKGTLTGKAADRNTVLAVFERLQKNPRITAWNPGEIREVDARSREHSFSVTFDFNPGEQVSVVLSKRERFIGIGAGTLLGIFIVQWVVVGPLLERKTQLDLRITEAKEQRDRDDRLIETSKRAEKYWADMSSRRLPRDGYEADQMLNNLNNWAQDAGVNLSSVKSERTEKEKDFYKKTFRAAGSGGMSQIGRFLYKIQTATGAARISDLTLNSRKEGTDDLSVSVGVATIYPVPESEKNRPGAVAEVTR